MARFKKVSTKRSKGLSLVEIIVAIGISVITLTTSAVFSTRLIIRAQQNFMQDSAVQLSNIIVEELRLAEVDMQSAKKIVSQGGSAVPKVFASAGDWTKFCSVGGNANLGIDLPKVINNPATLDFKISFVSDITNGDFEGQQYRIEDITDKDKLTGAFYIGSGSSVQNLGIGIQRKIDNTNAALGQIVNLNIILRYYLFNIKTAEYTKYTRPINIKMIRDTICL